MNTGSADRKPVSLAAVSCMPWLLLAAALCAPCGVVRAEASLHVETRVDACVPLDRAKFEYLFNIELGTEPSNAGADNAATLTLSCADKLILVSVQDLVTRKVVTRLVDLSAVDPSARARLMALTASELVLASWMEVRMEPRSVIPPVGPPPKAAVSARVNEVVAPQLMSSTPPLRLGASATASTFLSSPAPIFGLELHLTQPISNAWAWNISLFGGRGHLNGTLGDGARSVAVGVTTAALAWSLRYTHRFGSVDSWLGAAGLFGVAYLTGSAPASSSLVETPAYAPWAGPALQLAAAYPVSDGWRVLVQLEAGLLLLGASAVVRSPKADDQLVITELRGGWLAGQLGCDFAL